MDRRYRLAALGLGVAAVAMTLLIWLWGIIGRLRGREVSVRSPIAPWIAGTCLGLLAAGLGGQALVPIHWSQAPGEARARVLTPPKSRLAYADAPLSPLESAPIE